MATSAGRTITDRKRGVAQEFDGVAHRYDLMCRLNPGYRAHLRRSAARAPIAARADVLDLCCGTGLSTEALLAEHPTARVTALDASAGMLRVARGKRSLSRVSFVEGDASDPRAAGVEGSFDAIFMAYGLRNIADPDACLTRLRALLRPGGALVLHEYSLDGRLTSKLVWNAVTTGVVVPLGKAMTGTGELFEYLRESVVRFDTTHELERRLARAGFEEVSCHRMGGWQRGIVHTFVAHAPRGVRA